MQFIIKPLYVSNSMSQILSKKSFFFMLKPWNIIPGVTCRLHGTGIVLLLLEMVAQITIVSFSTNCGH